MSNWIITISFFGAVFSGIALALCVLLDAAWPIFSAVDSIFIVCDIVCTLWILFHLFDEPDPERRERLDKKRWDLVIHKDPLTTDAIDEDFHRDRTNEDWHGT